MNTRHPVLWPLLLAVLALAGCAGTDDPPPATATAPGSPAAPVPPAPDPNASTDPGTRTVPFAVVGAVPVETPPIGEGEVRVTPSWPPPGALPARRSGAAGVPPALDPRERPRTRDR